MGDDAVQRAAGRQQLSPRAGSDHLRDQGVDGRALDAAVVAGVFLGCGLGSKQIDKLLARVIGAAVGQRCDVKVKFLQALLVERIVDAAKVELHSNFFQIARPGRDRPGAGVAAVQQLQHQHLIFCIAQGTVAVFPTGLLQ